MSHVTLLHVGALFAAVFLEIFWFREIWVGGPRGAFLSSLWIVAMVVTFIIAFTLFDFALSR